MAVSQEDKYARRVFRHLDTIHFAISEKAEMLTKSSSSLAYKRAVSGSATAFMHHVADPDTDLDTVDIHGWPWPKPEDFPAEEAPLTLSEALEESIEDNPDLFDDDAPAEPDAELAAENERLRARVAELEASPPPSPAVVALEGMEALKAKIDAGRVSVPAELQSLMEEGESVSDAKQRLWPKLMAELDDLQNQEALFGRSIPRRAEVESLLGILGRLGEY